VYRQALVQVVAHLRSLLFLGRYFLQGRHRGLCSLLHAID
jgi:hypothetical protein